jgi:hypothetical protein
MTGGLSQWIASEGGPLLLLPADLLPLWEGVAPPAAERVIVATFRALGPEASATDYERACDVADALGLLDIGPGQGLVLGDEPAQTAWWPLAAGGLLVRWHYATSEAAVLAALRETPPTVFGPPACVLTVGPTPLILFDAALPGSEALRGEHLRLALPPGAYTVATADYRPDRALSLTVHRLLQKSATAGSGT